MRDKNGKIPDDKFENDLEFDVDESNDKYSPEFLKKRQALIDKLKNQNKQTD